jgi:hypothetical protein
LADPANPQSWNRYAYVLTNPLLGSLNQSALDRIAMNAAKFFDALACSIY